MSSRILLLVCTLGILILLAGGVTVGGLELGRMLASSVSGESSPVNRSAGYDIGAVGIQISSPALIKKGGQIVALIGNDCDSDCAIALETIRGAIDRNGLMPVTILNKNKTSAKCQSKALLTDHQLGAATIVGCDQSSGNVRAALGVDRLPRLTTVALYDSRGRALISFSDSNLTLNGLANDIQRIKQL